MNDKAEYKERWSPDDGFLDLPKTAARLGISLAVARAWRRDGKIISAKFSGSNKWFITVASVEAIEAERREKIRAAIAKTEVAMITGVTPDGQ